jgi:hypothetical protein
MKLLDIIFLLVVCILIVIIDGKMGILEGMAFTAFTVVTAYILKLIEVI